MRKQLYVSIGSREVWREAEAEAQLAGLSLSDFTAAALRDRIQKLKKQRAAANRGERS